MSQLSGKDHDSYTQHMFAHQARQYVRANHWLTWGQDEKWRREVIQRAWPPIGGRLLDVGTGTGDLALEAVRRGLSLLVVAGDFTPQMMQVGRIRAGSDKVNWVVKDALELPYPSGCFDAVVSGYLLRNVSDVQKALAEQYRVLKEAGKMVCLDTTPPPKDIWHLPARWYLQYAIPVIGGWASGEKDPYRYLSDTTTRFISAPELAECMRRAGFCEVKYRRFMGGCMAIHWGVKQVS